MFRQKLSSFPFKRFPSLYIYCITLDLACNRKMCAGRSSFITQGCFGWLEQTWLSYQRHTGNLVITASAAACPPTEAHYCACTYMLEVIRLSMSEHSLINVGGMRKDACYAHLHSWFHLVSRITEQDERLTVLFKCINAKVSTSFFLSVCVGKPFDSTAVDRRSGPVLLACSWKVVWVSRREPESVSVLTFWHFQLLSPINSGWHSWRC